MKPPSESQIRQRLVQVALGRVPADTVVRDVRILDVFTHKWLEHHDIVISRERIAWIGPVDAWGGKAAARVAGDHRRVVPGFGEAHKHIESTHLSPEWEA